LYRSDNSKNYETIQVAESNGYGPLILSLSKYERFSTVASPFDELQDEWKRCFAYLNSYKTTFLQVYLKEWRGMWILGV
jgi:hypothetical protein